MLMLQIVLFFIFYLKYLIHIKNAIHSCLKGIILAREGCLYQKRLLFLSFLLFSGNNHSMVEKEISFSDNSQLQKYLH